MTKQLTVNFLDELLKSCMRDKVVLDVCIKNLEYHYLPSEPYKMIWREIRTTYINEGVIPSIGSLSERFNDGSDSGDKAREILSIIKTISIVGREEIIGQLNEFVKDSMSLEFWDEFVVLYKKGEKDQARKMMRDWGEKLYKFSVTQNTKFYDRVFHDFPELVDEWFYSSQIDNSRVTSVPFSIDELDALTTGLYKTDTACFLSRSGTGKSRFLRHVGVGAARRGLRVLHIQLEGGRDECLAYYTASWTAVTYHDIRHGNIDSDKMPDLRRIAKKIINKGGEIVVHSFEDMGSAGMGDVVRVYNDIVNMYGVVDLVLIDYLELLDPDDGRKYAVSEERHRRKAIGVSMKNFTMMNQTPLVTCTQASDINPKSLENPDFVLTRHNVSECKGLADPFSIFMSGNQTPDEYEEGIMRIHLDKIRHKKGSKTITIYQDYDHNRFYDRRTTINALSDDE